MVVPSSARRSRAPGSERLGFEQHRASRPPVLTLRHVLDADTLEGHAQPLDQVGRIVPIDIRSSQRRRLSKACGRANRVTLYTYAASTPVWWKGIADKLSRLSNLAVWQIDATASQALAALANRSMQLQITVQDGLVWVSDGTQTVELHPQALKEATR